MTATLIHERNDKPTSGQVIADRLTRLRDEIVVKNHLAGMEVKEAIHELGHELEKLAAFFARGVHAAAALPQDARLHTYLSLFDANTRLLEMESAIKTALTGAARSATDVAEHVRLKTALGRMDAEAAVDARRHALAKEMHLLEARSAKALSDIDARLTKLGIKVGKVV